MATNTRSKRGRLLYRDYLWTVTSIRTTLPVELQLCLLVWRADGEWFEQLVRDDPASDRSRPGKYLYSNMNMNSISRDTRIYLREEEKRQVY